MSERPRGRLLRLGRDGGGWPRLPYLGEQGGMLTRRYLGIPWVFAIVYSTFGLTIYFALGLVAERGLGLTPLVFLAAALFLILTALTYVEGSAMFGERGGSATFARHGFNELVSFVAGWAILIDYIIVIALAAISVPHYLTPISASFQETGWELLCAGAVIALAAAFNVAGFTGQRRQVLLVTVALLGGLLLLAVIVAGVASSFDPGALTAELDLFQSPTVEDLVYAVVIATIAYAGIEVASNLSPEIGWQGARMKRLVVAGAVLVPILYTGVAAVGLMAVPVIATPEGPQTELGTRYIEEPLLGIVASFEPAWLSAGMEVAVVAVVPAALLFAASTSMLGLSRHVYVLARNRQIPSWLGKLNVRWSTPHVAIAIGAVMAFALVLPSDVRFLAGVFAFGALLAFTIAHLSILRLRAIAPDRPRPFRVPLDVSIGPWRLPLPALAAAVLTALAWVTVIVFHEGARYLGGGWMLAGIVSYVIYRRVFEGTSITQRLSVPERALMKERPDIEYTSILVPVFGTALDDEIVGTAGRLADAADEPGEAPPHIDVVYVIELPLSVPLDAPPPTQRIQEAERALERAKDVAEEYETIEVSTSIVRARDAGSGIVGEARRRGVEAIVMGAEPPTRVRGGAVLGGVPGTRPEEVGPVTEYVLRKAPCPVLLTAPPEG